LSYKKAKKRNNNKTDELIKSGNGPKSPQDQPKKVRETTRAGLTIQEPPA